MSQRRTLPDDVALALRALRLDAAVKTHRNDDLQDVGRQIGLNKAVYITRWRKGELQDKDNWQKASVVLGVPYEWLYDGCGRPDAKTLACYLWILADPCLPRRLTDGASEIKLSRRLPADGDALLDQAEADAASSELVQPQPQPDHVRR